MNQVIQKILEIDNFSHKKIQNQLVNIFEQFRYDIHMEEHIQAERGGRIDIVARKNGQTVGIEIDHATIKRKSIDKLNQLNPDLAIFILKSERINREAIQPRLKLIKTNSLLIHLPTGKITNLTHPANIL